MLIEEEEPKSGEVNPDALEAVFVEEAEIDIFEEDVLLLEKKGEEDEADEIDIAFAANDEGYW